MADGNPKFGGTNGVALLDIGQLGGTRQAAGQALFSGHVIFGSDEVPMVETKLPQQEAVYRDVLGFSGSIARWQGVIRADSSARMATIIKELNQRKHGSLRNDAGVLSAVDVTKFRETQLTDSFGNVLSTQVVFQDWNQRSRLMTGSEWALLMQVSIEFRILG